MTLTLLNVIYVLIAIAMVGFILVQRGAGAQAGSGFGAGASATVFGARGAGNFLTRSTAVLATVFFLLSLGMGMYVSRGGLSRGADDLGVMGDQPAASEEVPAAAPAPSPASDVPAPEAAPAATPSAGDVPAAPAATPTASPSGDDAKAPSTR
jgi:preprotein translocase subunit SecG